MCVKYVLVVTFGNAQDVMPDALRFYLRITFFIYNNFTKYFKA